MRQTIPQVLTSVRPVIKHGPGIGYWSTGKVLSGLHPAAVGAAVGRTGD